MLGSLGGRESTGADDAMSGDCTTALDQLAEATTSCEDTMTNQSLTSEAKLRVFEPHVKKFFDGEAEVILGDGTYQQLKVVNHSAFGHIQRLILLTYCTCSASTSNVKSAHPKTKAKDSKSTGVELNGGGCCSFHMDDPDLNELVFAICNAVHNVLGDSWACFAAVFAHESTQGTFQSVHSRKVS